LGYHLEPNDLHRYRELGLDGLVEKTTLVLPKQLAAAKTLEETDTDEDRPGSSAGLHISANRNGTMTDGARPGSSASQQDTVVSNTSSSTMAAEGSAAQPSDKAQPESPVTTSEPIQPETPTKSSSDVVTPTASRFQQDIGVSTLPRPRHLQLPSLTSSSPIKGTPTFALMLEKDCE